MEPGNEHAFYAWLIIIGAVCIAILIGAMVDRFFLNRRLGRLRGYSRYYRPAFLKEISHKGGEFKK